MRRRRAVRLVAQLEEAIADADEPAKTERARLEGALPEKAGLTRFLRSTSGEPGSHHVGVPARLRGFSTFGEQGDNGTHSRHARCRCTGQAPAPSSPLPPWAAWRHVPLGALQPQLLGRLEGGLPAKARGGGGAQAGGARPFRDCTVFGVSPEHDGAAFDERDGSGRSRGEGSPVRGSRIQRRR